MKALRIQRGWWARPDKLEARLFSLGRSSSLVAIPHFGLLRPTVPKNSAASTFGLSPCCCWQILCQEAERTMQLHCHKAPGHSDRLVHLTKQGLLAKALKLSWPGLHWPDRPGYDGFLLFCFWPCNSFLYMSTWVFCVLCVLSSFRKHIFNFSHVHVSEAVGGSGNCTNGGSSGFRVWY